MASIQKYKASAIGRLFLHTNRTKGDETKHSNESIDDNRTMYNYYLKKGSVSDVKKRLKEIYFSPRKDAVVLAEAVVTLPKNVEPKDERDFFQGVYDFYAQDFGEENIVNAVIHKDEVKPHIHLSFVPVVPIETKPRRAIDNYNNWVKKNGREPTERLCCKELVTKQYLMSMHERLQEYIEGYIGYRAEILNGATAKGNKTILELKVKTLKEKIEQMENQKKHLGAEINNILSIATNNGVDKNEIGLYPLMQKIEDLVAKNNVLKSIITRQGYTYTKEELESMKPKAIKSSKSMSVNIYDGCLNDAEIDKDAIVVIELPDKKQRPLKQAAMIEKDSDLDRIATFAQSVSKQVISRQSRLTDRTYIFIKADSPEQTLTNLLEFERQLRELNPRNRKVFMERLEYDSFDFARNILQKNNVDACYFTGRGNEDEKTKFDKENYIVRE